MQESKVIENSEFEELQYDIFLLENEIAGCIPSSFLAECLYNQLVEKRIELAVLKDTEGL